MKGEGMGRKEGDEKEEGKGREEKGLPRLKQIPGTYGPERQ